MRRTAFICAALLAALAMAAAATAARATDLNLDLIPAAADHEQIYPATPVPWTRGRTVGYWGRFKQQGGNATSSVRGSYRATCIWLADRYWPNSPTHRQDNRLSCTIVFGFTPLGGTYSSLILQGFVKRPAPDDDPSDELKDELFSEGFKRNLAVTGGTGAYQAAHGVADIQVSWTMLITYALAPV
jgi:hypothetical protein